MALAPYAMRVEDSAGRDVPEPPHPYRNDYQRDRDRITHSAAFRRLSHKTQVFTGMLGDYHRNRLTHTLEVASIARTVARALGLNEDLTEALALAHDIGHPPFGHAGEGMLNERLKEQGGFNHNRQALRIVELLEQRYADRPGLNLTAEVLDGQRARGDKPARAAERLDPQPHPDAQRLAPVLEAQVVDAADRIAYDAHDADDAIQIGLLELDELTDSTLWADSVGAVHKQYCALTPAQLRRATVHGLIERLVSDLLETSSSALERGDYGSVEKARGAGLLIAPSTEIVEQQRALERILFERVYRHDTVLEQRRVSVGALEELYQQKLADPSQLRGPYAAIIDQEGAPRAVADYVSSLTDRAVLEATGHSVAPVSAGGSG